MSNIRGNISTYDQPGQIIEDLSNAVRFGAAYQAPLFSLLERKPATDKTHKWVEDAPNPRTSTTSAAASAGATTLSVAAGDRFAEGDIVIVQSEYVRVSSVSGNDLTVSRAFGGTTAAAHSTGVTVTILTNAQPENAGPEALATAKAQKSNATQIFIRPVNVSRTMQHVHSASGNELDYQISKASLELALDVERALLRGKLDAGSDSGARALAGLDEFIVSEVDNEEGTLSLVEFNQFLRGIWENGGNPDVLLCDGLFIATLHEWNVGSIEAAMSSHVAGVHIVRWVSPFGTFDLLPDRQAAPGTCYALTSSSLALAVLDDVHYQELARTGDGVRGQVVAELTLECANERFHGRQHGVTGSA